MPRIKKTTVTDTAAANTAAVETVELETKSTNTDTLIDSDEIEVVSLIPNVSYIDKKSGDEYRWNTVGDIEIMTFSSLKEMRRNAKTYFNELWLKPLDERVIKYLGLDRVYKIYDELMDKSSYTIENISNTCKKIIDSPNGIKWTLLGKIKTFVEDGDIADVKVLRTLERQLNVELLSLL